MVFLRRHVLFTAVATGALLAFSSVALAGPILVKDGSTGAPVRRVQSLLIEQGYLSGTADGICGPATVKAIRSFQSDRGLTVDGICGNGTFRVLNGGKDYEGGQTIRVQATAYTSEDPGNSDHTYTGKKLRRGMMAVDPAVIPLGTHVYVPGYGDAVAEDIGGDIHGHRIDLAFESREEALRFGRRDLDVYLED